MATATSFQSPLLYFQCSHCGAGLSVSSELSGVTAPCPNCYQPVQAPYAPVVDAGSGEVFPPSAGAPENFFPELPPIEDPRPRWGNALGGAPLEPAGIPNPRPKFHASRVIPKESLRLEAHNSSGHEEYAKRWRRRRRVEKQASAFLQGAFFRRARVVLGIAATAAILMTARYMKKNKGRLPWEKAPVATSPWAPPPASSGGASSGAAAAAPKPSPAAAAGVVDVAAGKSGPATPAGANSIKSTLSSRPAAR